MLWGSEVDFVVCVTEVTPDRVGRSVGPDWVGKGSVGSGGGRLVGRVRLKIFAALRAAVGRSVGRTMACENHPLAKFVCGSKHLPLEGLDSPGQLGCVQLMHQEL